MNYQRMKMAAGTASLFFALSVCGPLNAQQVTLGEFEFMNSCAACHGADGKGIGSISGFLNQPVPDLTQLQKNNGGVFPVTATYAFISGESEVGAHGSRDMPAWGRRYTIRGENDPEFGEAATREYVNLRILALVEHLASIQAE